MNTTLPASRREIGALFFMEMERYKNVPLLYLNCNIEVL